MKEEEEAKEGKFQIYFILINQRIRNSSQEGSTNKLYTFISNTSLKTRIERNMKLLGMVRLAFSPSTQQAEAGGAQTQPGVHSECQASQGYTVRACLNKEKKEIKQTWSLL